MDDRRTRRTARAGLLLAAVGAAVGTALVAATVPASAHVTIEPGAVEGGGFSVVSFRVPNERDDASTTKVRVLLPADRPLGFVQTTPVPGWRIATRQRELDEPLELFGSEVADVVSEVTWSAAGEGVQPGQFQDFALSLGPLPDSGELVFTTVQTYSSGERVTWNEVAVDESAEPERPAPALTLTAPEEASASASDADDGGSALPVGLSVAALLVALAALALGLKRRTG